MDYQVIAQEIIDAEDHQTPIPRITDRYETITLAEAYQIQDAYVAKRLQAGKTALGVKAALTSKGMQKLLGVDQPACGVLFSENLIPSGGSVPAGKLISPKAEGELTFYIEETLQGPGVTAEDVMHATGYVVPSIEIAECRVSGDWKVKLQDMVAENTSFARIVLGDAKTAVNDIDMTGTKMQMVKNGVVIGAGTTIEVLGSPAQAVAELANMLADYGKCIPAGSLVMSGAVIAAVPCAKGDHVEVIFEGIGKAEVTFC